MFGRIFASALLVALATVASAQTTTTPIKHVVVIFGENNSFDHYFGTYPVAANPPNEPAFQALAGTPTVNGLGAVTSDLVALNPNSAKPFRLDRSDAVTCDNDNAYDAEQQAYDSGLLDKFPQFTSAQPTAINTTTGQPCDANLAMGYYDGNTVTALWNYAQHYAMSDNFHDTEFGVTVEGHLNLISGQTHQTNVATIAGIIANGSVIANINPSAALDDCTSGKTVTMTSRNVGDLLNLKGVTWGWFYGDFTPTTLPTAGTPSSTCPSSYNAHYMPFQYYQSTANPHHLPPSSTAAIGTAADQANHQYDLNALTAALNAGNLPAVTFIKAPQTQTGHPQKSDPLSEQEFLVTTINALMQSSAWPSMAIFLTYDDSDGWYDHVMPPIVNQSNDAALDHICTGPIASGAFNDRCGYGTRLPFIAISPFAKANFVDQTVTDLASILVFIESNWGLGFIDPGSPAPGQASFDRLAGSIASVFNFTGLPNLKKLILDPDTGVVVSYR